VSIPDDILAIAGVVTGDDRTKLGGWQRRDAIAAMTALGYSGAHIGWALRTSQAAIYKTASEFGLRLNIADQRLDWTAIDMVVNDGECLHLSGLDRAEAVRQMAPHHTSTEIARRLRTDATEIARVARRDGITIRQPDPWSWYTYLSHKPQRQAVAA